MPDSDEMEVGKTGIVDMIRNAETPQDTGKLNTTA
jgi:hypothetical protein